MVFICIADEMSKCVGTFFNGKKTVDVIQL